MPTSVADSVASLVEASNSDQNIVQACVDIEAPEQQMSESLENPVLDQNKPSKTSARVRPNINYTNLAQGTGEVSANLDYSEVS